MTKIYADSEEKYLFGVVLYPVTDTDSVVRLCKVEDDEDTAISAEEFNQYAGKGLIRIAVEGGYAYPATEILSYEESGTMYAGSLNYGSNSVAYSAGEVDAD